MGRQTTTLFFAILVLFSSQPAAAEMIFSCSIVASNSNGNIKLPVKRLTCAATIEYCDQGGSLNCVDLLRYCDIKSRRTSSCSKQYDESDVPAGYQRNGGTAVSSILIDDYLVRGCYSPSGSALVQNGTDSDTGLPLRSLTHNLTCAR